MNDLISRQAVLDKLERCHITSGVKNQGTWNECVDSIIRTIGSMPSVQPEQKEITMEEVETYCKQRNLIVITKELFDDMSKLADKIYLHLKDKENQVHTHNYNCYTCKYYSIEYDEEPCKTCIEEQSIKNKYPKYIQKE